MNKGLLDIRQSENYAKYLKNDNWIVEKKDGVHYFVKKILFFSIIKIQRPAKVDLDFIKVLAKKHKAFQIIIEPTTFKDANYLIDNGWKLSFPYLPSKTIFIDLTKPKDILLSEMHQKTRYNIKVAAKKGVVIEYSTDIDAFADFWQENARDRHALPQKKHIKGMYRAFSEDAKLLIAKHDGKLVAGVLVLIAYGVGYYMYASASAEGKKLFAPTLCAWRAILYAKQRGAKLFDFEGIYDERFPLKGWLGFTKFKKGFGGREVKFPSAYQKILFGF